MYKENKVKKVCGFYVSSIHFITMILPYLIKKVEENKKIITFFQNDLSKEISIILSRININNNKKEKIEKIKWNEENILNADEEFEHSSIIIVAGEPEYIDKINKKIESTNKTEEITIINCFEISQEQYNIRKIVDEYNYLINTKGIRKKEEIFIEEKVAK